MLDPRLVSDNIDAVRAALARRGFKDEEVLARLVSSSGNRRMIVGEVEGLRAERNAASEAMARVDKKSAEFAAEREKLRGLGDRIKLLEDKLRVVEAELEDVVLALPNVPHPDTPDGLTDEHNVEVRRWGEAPKLDFPPRDHVDLGKALGILDMEAAGKISGARFVVLRGAGSRLTRALMSFMLDVHTSEHGYQEVWTPVLVKSSALRGTGQLPKFEKDLFKIAGGWQSPDAEGGGEDLYLIPTAEVPITNLRADEVLEGEQLPIDCAGYTACFRSEAGSYGKDTRGMIRVHQFDKVELVRIVRRENGEAALEELVRHAESILVRLQLHHRVVRLCAGEMSFAAQKAYDVEVWLPGQQKFREISSCSWFGDFQARRMKTRYRPGPKQKPELVHTLNGSGLAIGRTLVAILEQYQEKDGSVRIPNALVPYMGGLTRIGPP